MSEAWLFLPGLSLLVLRPSFLGERNVARLALLRSTAQQNYERVAVFPEVDAVARPEVDCGFEHPGAHALHTREVALLNASERDRHFRRRRRFEVLEPSAEWAATRLVQIFPKRSHPLMVTRTLLFRNATASEILRGQTDGIKNLVTRFLQASAQCDTYRSMTRTRVHTKPQLGPAKAAAVSATKGSGWLTVREAAGYLRVGVDLIYDACAVGGLKHVRLGYRTIRLRREWVDTWADGRASFGSEAR